MGRESGSPYGACVERGIVRAVTLDEKNIHRYTIESYDRPGITADRITNVTNLQPGIGAKVCFFMFDDGTGCIVGGLI